MQNQDGAVPGDLADTLPLGICTVAGSPLPFTVMQPWWRQMREDDIIDRTVSDVDGYVSAQ
jgi:hypothetical protein